MSRVKAKIIGRRLVAESTYLITFECEQIISHFKPGQYVEVSLPKLLYPDTKAQARNFSIVSSPNDKNVSIVFRASGSGFKRTLIDLPLESQVMISGPFGSFKLANEQQSDVVFVAGGIGIAPFMSMLRYATEEQLPLRITLLYVNDRPERALFVPELKNLAEQNENLTLRLKYGYIDIDFMKECVNDPDGKLWFVAGSPAMTKRSQYLLHELGVGDENIMIEPMSSHDTSIHGVGERVFAGANNNQESLNISGENPFLSNSILAALSQMALVTLTDKQGNIVYASDYFSEMSGFTKEELIGQNHRIMKSTYHPQSFYKDLWDTIRKGNTWRGEVCNKAKNGSLYWADSTVAPIFGKGGEIMYYIAMRFPITERKKAEAELYNKTELLERTVMEMRKKEADLEDIKKATLNILEDLDFEKRAVERKVKERTLDLEYERNKLLLVTRNMKGGAILCDKDGEVLFVNQRLYELLDITNIEIDTSSVLQTLFNYFDGTQIKEYFNDCFKDGKFYSQEIEAQGKIFEINFLNVNTEAATDRQSGCFILIYDITDVKLLERTKSQLVAVASHQLRTPLTAMRGNIEMLIDESFGSLNDMQHEMLNDIDISTARLISMVNEMLDITKIEKGDLNMVLKNISLKEVIDSILADLGDYASRSGVTVTSTIPVDLIVYSDASRVRQVLQNLIDNAIKYSKNPGKIEISSSSRGNFAQIIISDDGIGIPKQEQTRIFGRFYRASNTINSSGSGSGLGLYIVRSIISQLGGDIWFESEENVGTTFFVTFPITKIEVNGVQSHPNHNSPEL